MIRAIVIAVLFMSLRAIGATWYLDELATSGNNRGTNWANAWTNVTAVVWGASGVKAGDTLTISSGSYTNSTLFVGASGTSNSWITIEASRESGHNSTKVKLNSINFQGNQWIKVNGDKDTNYAFQLPWTVFTNQAALTNNIGLQITHDDKGSDSQAMYVSGDSGANIWVRWVEFGPIAVNLNTNGWDGNGIRFINLNTNGNWKVQACWFHDIRNDDINLNVINGQNPTNYDATIIEYCWLQGGGDDSIQWTRNGFTARHNFFNGHLTGFFLGHPDHIQFSGAVQEYVKVVNNIFDGNANSIIKGEHLVSEGSNMGNWIWAGNYFFSYTNWTSLYDFGEPLGNQAWRANADTNANVAYQRNAYFMNNTFYYLPAGSGIPWFVGRAAPTNGTRSAWVIYATNGLYANNLGVDLRPGSPSGGVSWSWQGDGAGGGPTDTNGIYYVTNSVRWLNNILAGEATSFKYFGQTWTNGEHLGMGNKSAMPKLVSTNTYDFRLASDDTNAVGAGYDWSTFDSLTNNHPELMLDLFGNPRFRNGVVDVGAAAATASGPDTNNLVLWYRFRDDLTDGRATDSSPMAIDGLHYGYVNDQVASNRFPTSITWTNPVTGVITNAAFFNRTNDGWGSYTVSGDYVVSTNDAFRSTPNLSVSLWFYYQPHDAASAVGYTNISNMRPISGGYGYEGAWTLGLTGDQFTKLRIYTNNNANSEKNIGWINHSISISGSFQGYSTNWAWLGFTWDKGTLKQYFNGALVRTTNIQSAVTGGLVTNLTVRGPAGGLTGGFFMVGGDSHNGNPQLTPFDDAGEQLPNHAWFTGGIADLMIYTRTLSDTEMSNNYAQNWSSSGGSGGGGGGGGSGGTPRHNVSVSRLTVGRITGP